MRQLEDEKSKKKKQTDYSKAQTNFLLGTGSSGYTGHKDESSVDEMSDDTDCNVQIGYFDPPLERFAFVSRQNTRQRDGDTDSKSDVSRSI